jgi:ADP-heptose:LPS heptosyltransferase
LLKIPIDSVRPIIRLTQDEREFAAGLVREPNAVLSMHSNANPKRDDGEGGVKDWPLDRWQALCQHLRKQGIQDIVAVGSEFDTQIRCAEFRNLYGLPIRIVAALMEQAACVVTLENGIGHLAHAVDAPMVMIYSDVVPLGWACPAEATRCKVLYGPPTRTELDQVVAAVNEVTKQSMIVA